MNINNAADIVWKTIIYHKLMQKKSLYLFCVNTIKFGCSLSVNDLVYRIVTTINCWTLESKFSKMIYRSNLTSQEAVNEC